MLEYIGTKIIQAEPQNGTEGEDGYKVVYEGGYTSWSPKDVFEKAYKTSGSFTFGDAVFLAEQGKKVARIGWNGANMYFVIMPGFPNGVPANKDTAKAHGVKEGDSIVVRPYFALWTAQGDLAMWAPSGSDALAKDWVIVP